MKWQWLVCEFMKLIDVDGRFCRLIDCVFDLIRVPMLARLQQCRLSQPSSCQFSSSSHLPSAAVHAFRYQLKLRASSLSRQQFCSAFSETITRMDQMKIVCRMPFQRANTRKNEPSFPCFSSPHDGFEHISE